MSDPISGATHTPSANVQPPRSRPEAPAREPSEPSASAQQEPVQQESVQQQPAQAPRQDQRPESQRPDADDRVGTHIDTEA